MRYERIQKGIFLERPNRFIALVQLDGKTVVCHVKNTGRCRELLVPGASVYLTPGVTPGRKTPFDLIAVEKGERLINMDAQAPNRVFAEWASCYEPNVSAVLPEYRCGQSRLDFCLKTPDGLHFVEVKGVTLERDGHTFFPDAPTQRGVKHLHELIRLAGEGYSTTVFFVIQMEDVTDFSPNDETHPAFGEALREASASGVNVVAYSCRVCPDSMEIDRRIPVVL